MAGNLEYVVLRLIRRFLLKGWILDRLRGWIPHYRASLGESSPADIVDLYWKYCRLAHLEPEGKTILEIGAGLTNGTAYEITGRGAHGIAYEPYVPLDPEADRKVFESRIAPRHPTLDRGRIRRVSRLDELAGSSVDLVLSHSVLEHVRDMARLLLELKRVLRPKGCMIHIVDYRDHFFKYPFHFLQFSSPVWYRYLDPGDLCRARIGDHLRAFEAHGFRTAVLAKEQDIPSLMSLKRRIHSEFQHHSLEDLATTWAVLHGERI